MTSAASATSVRVEGAPGRSEARRISVSDFSHRAVKRSEATERSASEPGVARTAAHSGRTCSTNDAPAVVHHLDLGERLAEAGVAAGDGEPERPLVGANASPVVTSLAAEGERVGQHEAVGGEQERGVREARGKLGRTNGGQENPEAGERMERGR